MSTKRSSILDNAKYLMIFAVVVGHVIEPFITTHPLLATTYLILYSFHMPVFIIISGMLSRNKFSADAIKRLLKTLIVPFVIFTIIYEYGHIVMFGETSIYFDQKIPYWILWYLPSLFFWRATLPFMSKIPLALPISLLSSILIGFVTNAHEIFGVSRTLYFWPFFLLGFKLTPAFLEGDNWQKIPKYFWAIIVAVILTVFWTMTDMNPKVLYGSLSYDNLGQGNIAGAFQRLIIMAIHTLMSFAVIGLIPKRLPVPKHWKSNTLSIYLWHGLILKMLLAIGLTNALKTLPITWLAISLIIMTIIIMIAFSSKLAAKVTKIITLKPSQ